MKRNKFIVPNDISSLSNNLKPVLNQIIDLSISKKVFLLKGQMGVGKTTLMAELGKFLHITDPISSPTFSIVNEHEKIDGTLVFHFDLYRIKDEEELYNIGFEEYLNQGALVFIEWPEVAKSFLPEDCVTIEIIQVLNGREITLQQH